MFDDWSGGGLLRMLELNFSTFRLFAALALGAEPDYVWCTANPVKRYIQKNVETELASMMIRGTLMDGCTVEINSDGKKLIFTVK